MAFNMCPLSPYAAKLFGSGPQRVLSPRLPIAVRATELRNRITLSKEKAFTLAGSKSFVIGESRFQLLNNSKSADKDLIAATLVNFSPVFDHNFVSMWLEDDAETTPVVSIKAFGPKTLASGIIPKPDEAADNVAFIEFNPLKKYSEMFIFRLSGNGGGYAGMMLSALYNTSKDTGLGEIRYFVGLDNINARQAYFHMDFGFPTDERAYHWKVPVE